jgi:hypothetical protein
MGIARLIRRRRCPPLLSLDDIRAVPTSATYAGVVPIPLHAIVGTLDRCCDFDACFHPLRPALADRVHRVRRFLAEQAAPAISVFRIGHCYFISDGHKRVAATRAEGIDFIDAEVTELHPPEPCV